jgi:hypothetical protein
MKTLFTDMVTELALDPRLAERLWVRLRRCYTVELSANWLREELQKAGCPSLVLLAPELVSE